MAAPRSARRLAWTLWVLCVAVAALGLGLLIPSLSATPGNDWGWRGFDAVHALAFATVGVAIALRRPENAIGWIFLAAGFCVGLQRASSEYGVYTLLVQPGLRPGGQLALWVAGWVWIPFLALVGSYLPLLFPNGSLLTPRWRVVAWGTGLAVVLALLGFLFLPGPLEGAPFADNPVGLEGTRELLNSMRWLGLTLLFICMLAAVASLILRLRQATGDELRQLKWMASAAAVLAVTFAISLRLQGSKPAEILVQVGVLLIPIAAGIAILKYGLYEIDLLIYRALLYSTLTAVLAGLYTASIALFQRVFVALTGERSDAAVVMTTLVVAAGFTPVKGRLQIILDKRLKENRDPARDLMAFNEQVQAVAQVIDIEQLARRLLDSAIRTFGASSGVVYVGESERSRVCWVHGDWQGDEYVSVPLRSADRTIGALSLGPRASGAPYTAADRQALEQTAAVVGRTIALMQRAYGQMAPELPLQPAQPEPQELARGR